MIAINREENMECYVVFVDHNVWRPWVPFLKKGYRHCYMLIPIVSKQGGLLANKGTLLIDSGIDVMTAALYDVPVGLFVLHNSEMQLEEVIKCTLASSREMQYSMEVLTCVTVVKRLLGRRWKLVQTPWQLRKKLIKSGIGKVHYQIGDETWLR